jgi:hypothetical protein
MIWKSIEHAIDEAIEHELRMAYRAGYREAAAIYGRNVHAIQHAYQESDDKSYVYVAERKETMNG